MRKILLSIIFILLFVSSASASNTWWDITFVNRTDNRLNTGSVPYQLNITVHNGAGASTATDLYIYCTQADCGDVRPILNNVTVLNYWWETLPAGAGTSGKLWINITTSSAGDVLNIYSGKSTTTTQNPWMTFNFFDHFTAAPSATNWTSSGTVTQAGTEATLTATADNQGLTTVPTFQSGNITRFRAEFRETNIAHILGFYSTPGETGTVNGYGGIRLPFSDATDYMKTLGGAAATQTSGGAYAATTYYTYQINRGSGSVAYNRDNGAWTLHTSNVPPSTYNIPVRFWDFNAARIIIDWVFITKDQTSPPTFGSWGSTFTYYITAPTLTSPTNGTWWNNTILTNLTWTAPTCGWCDTSTFFYQYWISTQSDFSDIVNETNFTRLSDFLNVSGADGIRYARVRANNSLMWGNWSTSRYYYVNNSGGLNLISPLNGSTQSANTVILQWVDSNQNAPYTYQLSTDSGFLNIISSGTGTNSSLLYSTSTINLQYNTQYWWHVKNASSAYTTAWNFTILPFTAVPGRLNITSLDEVNFTLIMNFTVSLYNASGAYLAKSTTNGWVNFTGSEVIEGDYLAIATGNSSYAERTLLMTSPGNYTFYLPSVSNTIDTVAFYLLDYTMKFPYLESNMTITRGSNITQSAGFDADAKQAANLIRGASYTITVANNNSGMIQQWGNYISTGSGNVQVVIMNLGVNQSVLNPYTQQINSSNTSIEMSWNDTASFLNSVNITVYKDNTSTPVYNLVTSIKTGTATYLITDSNAVYITQMIANTTLGTHSDTNVLDLTSNTATITLWSYGGFTMPAWVKNAFGIVALFMLAGSFGAMHRGEGAIITGIMAIFFYWWKILTQDSMIASMLGALLLFAILYHYASKSKPGGYF